MTARCVEPPAPVLSTPPWPKAPPCKLERTKGIPPPTPTPRLKPLDAPPHVFRRHDIILFCTKRAGSGGGMGRRAGGGGVNMGVRVNACTLGAQHLQRWGPPVLDRLRLSACVGTWILSGDKNVDLQKKKKNMSQTLTLKP